MNEGVEAVIGHMNRLMWVGVGIGVATMLAPRFAPAPTPPSSAAEAPPSPRDDRPPAERVVRALTSGAAAACEGASPVTIFPDGQVRRVMVSRQALDWVLQPGELDTARFVPETARGRVVGLRVFGLRADSALAALGLQNGDRLDTIDGRPVTSPEDALRVYADRGGSGDHDVALVRRGQRLVIHYVVCS